MQKKLTYLSKSKKLTVLALLLVILAALIVALLFVASRKSSNSSENQAVTQTQPTAEEVMTELLKDPHYYKLPEGGIARKNACYFFNIERAKQLLGDQASKDDNYKIVNHPDYDPSVCGYIAGTTKATVWLHHHLDESKVKDNLSELDNENNVAAVKGPYVVTAAVERNGNLDEQASNELLKEITDQL
ncbi:hypothetical protein KY385_03355 [Candidatus Parcubacteria bacterium]|nr:hypothetical protein [Candidatus Parcubacteria bacterium]